MVYLFELGEGEYVLEFETEEDIHEFNMVVLKMGGGHAHHDHGDDHDDHAGEDDHDDHGDDHDEEMTPEQALTQFDTNNDGQLSWEEFWDSMKDDAPHDNHDDHGDENNVAVLYPDNTSALFDNHQHLMDSGWNLTMDTMLENNITLNYSVDPNYGTMLNGINGIVAPSDYSWWWSLYLWNETSEAWQESTVGIDSIVIGYDTEHIAWAASNADMSLIPSPEDHDDDHAGEDGHDDHAGEDEHEDMYMEIFNTSDMNNDQMLNLSELGEFIEMLEDDEHEGAYATLHIEEEGVYGFALPMSINFHILKGEGGHDDHDDHAGEDNYDDHAGEDDHDDHSDEEGDDHSDHADEEIAFDPHSWLDPLAFKAQVNRVLEEMKIAFPDLADNFQSNADAYMASLDALHLKYEETFGPNGTCEKDTVVSNHNAYSYMSQRYGMEFVTVYGFDFEGELFAVDIFEVVE
jgi:ABC-type Zn uptake system ZnuABC Zn-binding protein ZnuA